IRPRRGQRHLHVVDDVAVVLDPVGHALRAPVLEAAVDAKQRTRRLVLRDELRGVDADRAHMNGQGMRTRRPALGLGSPAPGHRRAARAWLSPARMASFTWPFVARMPGPSSRQGPPCTFVTRPPASPTIRPPAAMSHAPSENSQKPSSRPHATQQRSSTAEPSRRTACDRIDSSAYSGRFVTSVVRMSYGKPVTRRAWSRLWAAETRIGSPFMVAPRPRSATKHSSRLG